MVLCLCLVQFWYQNKKSDQTAYLNQPNPTQPTVFGWSPVQPRTSPPINPRVGGLVWSKLPQLAAAAHHQSIRADGATTGETGEATNVFPARVMGGEWGLGGQQKLGGGGVKFFFFVGGENNDVVFVV